MKGRLFLTIVLVVIIVVMTGSVITLAQGPKKVDINFATLEELQTLPGVGPETAQAILDGRPYMNKKELQKVEGMGEKKFRRLQRLIVVKPLVINLATLDELKSLPGIEPETAQAIIDGRPYEKEEDLLRVKGMDEKNFKKIQSLIEMKLNINSATVYELETLPGIGPEIAQAIIDGRPYTEVDELLRIRGISEKKLAKIRDLLEIKVNINSATRDELGILPGIGPEIAQAIIDGRPYTEVDDLLRIRGIDEGILAKIQDFVEAKPIDGERGRKLPFFPSQGGAP